MVIEKDRVNPEQACETTERGEQGPPMELETTCRFCRREGKEAADDGAGVEMGTSGGIGREL
jgi:hypothetical protein